LDRKNIAKNFIEKVEAAPTQINEPACRGKAAGAYSEKPYE
jgi:hypothetical protein